MIGGKDDISHVHSILGKLESRENIIDLAGKTNIMELACILEECQLLITNDSGPLHLADSLGTPTVSFFGPETPVLYGPGNGKNLVFYKALMCSPCLDVLNAKTVSCVDNARCIKEINVDEVYEAILGKYPHIFETERD